MSDHLCHCGTWMVIINLSGEYFKNGSQGVPLCKKRKGGMEKTILKNMLLLNI